MKIRITFGLLLIVLISCGRARQKDGSRVVLPNPKLLRCSASGCSQLWENMHRDPDAIYPTQLRIDVYQSCLYGMVARYDKGVSLQEIKAAIDQRYGKGALKGNEDPTVPVKLWRVTPEKFAIQLGAVHKGEDEMTLGQAFAAPQRQWKAEDEVARQVIFLAFNGVKACR